MYIGVVGSRGVTDEKYVYEVLDSIVTPRDFIITGGANGVDRIAEKYAKEKSIPIMVIRPIDPTKKMDYLFRNVEIITKSELIVAIWDGESKGTKFVIDYAGARHKPVRTFIRIYGE